MKAKLINLAMLYCMACFGSPATPPTTPTAPQTQAAPAAECRVWFYNFPERGQTGTVMEVNALSLLDPRNLRAEYKDYTRFFETDGFRKSLFGKKVTQLTLYYNKCGNNTGQIEIVMQEAAADAAVTAPPLPQQSSPKSKQPATSPKAASAQPAMAAAKPCDPNKWDTVVERKGSQQIDLQRLVRAGKLPQLDADNLAKNDGYLQLMKSKDDFTMKRNECTNQLQLEPGVETMHVVEKPDMQAKKPSLFKTLFTAGSATGGMAAMLSGSLKLMILSPVIGAAPIIFNAIASVVHHKKKEDIKSRIRYGDGTVEGDADIAETDRRQQVAHTLLADWK